MPSIPKSHRPNWLPDKDQTRRSKFEEASFYDKPWWRRLTRIVRQEEPICPFCKTDTFIAETKVTDHIIPVRLGGDMRDRKNLQGICDSCHSIKSRHEAKCASLIELKQLYDSLLRGIGVKNFWGF